MRVYEQEVTGILSIRAKVFFLGITGLGTLQQTAC